MVKTATKPKVELIRASLVVMGRTYKATGDTVLNAITNLKPEIFKVHGVLVLEKGELRVEKIVRARIIMMLFGPASRMGKEIAEKQVTQLFSKADFE